MENQLELTGKLLMRYAYALGKTYEEIKNDLVDIQINGLTDEEQKYNKEYILSVMNEIRELL